MKSISQIALVKNYAQGATLRNLGGRATAPVGKGEQEVKHRSGPGPVQEGRGDTKQVSSLFGEREVAPRAASPSPMPATMQRARGPGDHPGQDI